MNRTTAFFSILKKRELKRKIFFNTFQSVRLSPRWYLQCSYRYQQFASSRTRPNCLMSQRAVVCFAFFNVLLLLPLMLALVPSAFVMVRRARPVHRMMSSASTSTTSACSLKTSLLNIQKPRVIFVLGGPGSGKGTQCSKMSSEFGLKHLSAGELLREEQASGSDNGKLIDSIIREGRIVPVQITLDLLRQAILGENKANRFLIDGFPRNWDNLHGWEGSMQPVCDVEAVMFIDCPEEELERRLLSRGLTSGRSDDNLATAKKRFATFQAATMPIVEHYASGSGKPGKPLLVKVRGDATIDDVYRDLTSSLTPLIEAEILQLTGLLLRAQAARDTATLGQLFAAGSEYIDSVYPTAGEPSNTPLSGIQLVSPEVKVLGKTAVVSYRRGGGVPGGLETRVWHLVQGRWRCVHSHT